MTPQHWDVNGLQRMREEGDPAADNVVKEIVMHGHQEEVNELFRNLATNTVFPNESFDHLDPHLKEAVTGYFAGSSDLPPWTDHKKLELAADVFARYGPEIYLILFCKSLPTCYLCWRGAKVLHGTGRLLVHDGSLQSFTRRLMETAQFVMNVMSPGGFGPDGNAIITIQKVRLIHATIRSYTLAGNWDINELGLPINQEDLALTYLTFTTSIIEGLEQLGAGLSDEEKDAYYHLWKVTGHFLGIRPDLLMDNQEEGKNLMDKILDHQAGPSPEGTALTEGCIDFLEDILRKKRYKDVPTLLIRYFIGDRWSQVLDLPSPGSVSGTIIVYAIRIMLSIMAGFRKKYKAVAFVSGKVKRRLLKGLIVRFNEGKQVTFRIPAALKEKWNL